MTGFCYTYLSQLDFLRESIVILYPYELRHEKVLMENIKHVPKYIYEIIELNKDYELCKTRIAQSVFDIDKNKYSLELLDIQEKIDKLCKKMNGDLAPYAWYIYGGLDSVINGVCVKADCACALEKI